MLVNLFDLFLFAFFVTDIRILYYLYPEVKARISNMQPAKRDIAFIQFLLLMTVLLTLSPGIMAQVKAPASVQATIMTYSDLTEMALSSADGDEFILQNDVNRCFDVTLDGIPSTLTGMSGKEKAHAELCLEQHQTVISGISKTRLNVLFSGLIKVNKGLATIPYSISVHYN